MIKQLKQYGNSVIITFDKEELNFYDLEPGDWVDIINLIKIKRGQNGDNRNKK
jgi:hypothetical protein